MESQREDEMSRIRIPLAVDSQLRIPLGPVQLPVRTCVALGIALLPMCVAFELPLGLGLRIAVASTVLAAATAFASPMKEGIWIGTYLLLRVTQRWFAQTTHDGRVPIVEKPARHGWRRWIPRICLPSAVRVLLNPVQRGEIGDGGGVFSVAPGGWRGVLRVEGPPCAIESTVYSRWCQSVMTWLRGLDAPTQFVTVVGHVNRDQAESAIAQTFDFEPADGPLLTQETAFAGDLAVKSLAFSHYVVISPRIADSNGSLTRWNAITNVKQAEVTNLLAKAVSSAKSLGLNADQAGTEEIACLLATSCLGGADVQATAGGVRIGGDTTRAVVVTKLGTDADFGMLVGAIQRSGVHGAVSMHLIPVSRGTVRGQLNRRRLWLRYALREGRPDIDLEVSLQDTERLQADLAAGSVEGLRIAITFRVIGAHADEVDENTARLQAVLAGHGWQTQAVTLAPLLPASVAAPGTAPLRRSLLLTTDAVAARLLPALGTPFAQVGDPIVGVNLRTGSSAYLSVFTRPNFNAVIVGSSGSGKSVTAKTFLARHVMRGSGACILDPDSEYGSLVRLLGGEYFELPNAALNPLALGGDQSADLAASRIVPVLSVMAGDDTEYVGGRAIRRLPGEDKAWLHLALRSFLHRWRADNQGEPLNAAKSAPNHRDFAARDEDSSDGWQSHTPSLSIYRGFREPLLREFLAELSDDIEEERHRRIYRRLRGFTQGELGQIFDRPSSFAIKPGSVTGIGFRALSLSYAADLTPALCVVLSHILDAIVRGREEMIVLVDEAHVLTSDPDAGQVLEQLVRRARKCRAGVWMCSQRVEEFVATDLGRTLASTAATKLVLGVEETVAEKVRSIFELADDECSALTPPVAGRGVLVSGHERTIVQVTPSPILWPFVATGETEDAA
jgi:Helicase HerA, central domain